MPRQARIDAPGALQHITIRGIERKAIFRNETDREDFIDRLGNLIEDYGNGVLCLGFMTNTSTCYCEPARHPFL